MRRGHQKKRPHWSSRSLREASNVNSTSDQQRSDNGSLKGPATTNGSPGANAAIKLRRGRFKLLSMVGLRKRSRSVFESSSGTLNRKTDSFAIPFKHSRLAKPPDRGARPSENNSGNQYLTTITHSYPATQDTQVSQHTEHQTRDLARGQRLELTSVNVEDKRKEPTGVTMSQPVPRQLSHNISTTFGTLTIIHRPNLCARPSVHSLYEQSALATLNRDQGQQIKYSTHCSSNAGSSGAFLGDRSTAKTSLGSTLLSLHYSRNKDWSERPIAQRQAAILEPDGRDKQLTPIQESPHVASPTIVTVENTANAKIFFETYYNSLFANPLTPRFLRRQELEERLQNETLTAEQRQREYHFWANQESEQLRQTRALKSRSDSVSGHLGVAVAGFEVVRVLGKGSFGVVRLVREKTSTDEDPIPQSSKPTDGLIRKQVFRDEPLHLKTTALGALKATLDGQRSSQRKETKKSRKEVFAMKVIRKSDMLRNSQEGHIRAERDFLVASEKSRWVVPLIASFQDKGNLYLVMEYMVGGDFLGLLFRKDVLREKKARWYVAEMILCVEEAHRLRWIHRDVKPDNFLISASGHLKISDFGLAFDGHWTHDQTYFNNHRQSLMEKLGIRVEGDSLDRKEGMAIAASMRMVNAPSGHRDYLDSQQTDGPGDSEEILQWRNRISNRKLARSVVGTSQYMAPEVIRGDLYDGRCDWWSIGIILYECLYGYTPFIGENRHDTKVNILNNRDTLRFPSEKDYDRKEKVSYEAMDLINSILQEKEHRLCSTIYKQNDYRVSQFGSHHLVATRADKQSRDYQGHFVYANDAEDIKGHPFFHGLSWERLHLSRPPFVPDVKGRDDTKYFDEEEPISDVDDASSTYSAVAGLACPDPRNGAAAVHTTQVDGANSPQARALMREQDMKSKAMPMEQVEGETKAIKRREKKRPRDRALRDKEVGRMVLELRKRGAFLGYTYRKPKSFVYEEERGRQGGSRRAKLPSMA